MSERVTLVAFRVQHPESIEWWEALGLPEPDRLDQEGRQDVWARIVFAECVETINQEG